MGCQTAFRQNNLNSWESHKKCHEEQGRRTENLSRKSLESEVGK